MVRAATVVTPQLRLQNTVLQNTVLQNTVLQLNPPQHH